MQHQLSLCIHSCCPSCSCISRMRKTRPFGEQVDRTRRARSLIRRCRRPYSIPIDTAAECISIHRHSKMQSGRRRMTAVYICIYGILLTNALPPVILDGTVLRARGSGGNHHTISPCPQPMERTIFLLLGPVSAKPIAWSVSANINSRPETIRILDRW